MIIIVIPIVIAAIFLIFGFKKFNEMLKLKKDINYLTERIVEFKKRSFSSYEEESRAKQSFKNELLSEIDNMPIPKLYKESLSNQVNML